MGKPSQVAQAIKMGRGWAVVRNSATLAITDYESIAHEIVGALNQSLSRSILIDALEATTAYVETCTGNGCRKQPHARYIKSNGDFDAEIIARAGRNALRMAEAI